MTMDYSIRFDSSALQESFVSELRQREINFILSEDGAVECTGDNWNAVNDVAHIIRDRCFKGYFTWFPTQEMARQYLNLLGSSGLPFQLEHHKDRDVFFLPRENKASFEELAWQVYDANRPG